MTSRVPRARGVLIEGITLATYKGATLTVHSAPGKELLLGEAAACCSKVGLRMEFRLLPKSPSPRKRSKGDERKGGAR